MELSRTTFGRDIVTRKSPRRNRCRGVRYSTNAALHLPAIANEAIKFDLGDVAEVFRLRYRHEAGRPLLAVDLLASAVCPCS
jgi:hypothetical protein